MFYIHKYASISPQQTFKDVDIDTLHGPVDKKMIAIEPLYDAIPPGILRRMGKSVRMGVGTALPLLQNMEAMDGILIGTANGGKEDCVKFLDQVIDYDEGMLTPINFVQSTPNAVAAQIGLLTKNNGYNITHLHTGLAFEYAAIDALMLLEENPGNNYLLGAVDDISTSNYVFDDKSGWHKKEDISNSELYDDNSPGTIAGEAACMFVVNGKKENAIAKVISVDTLHTDNEALLKEKLAYFIKTNLPDTEKIDLLLSGENGDSRFLKYYRTVESGMENDITIARFKHLCGEYPTATAMAVWICCRILQNHPVPSHMIKKGSSKNFKNILIYNNYKDLQHSFILVSVI